MNKGEKIEDKKGNITNDRINISPLEAKRIREAIEKSDTEKFHLFCRMMRIQIMLENATITHK